MNKLVEEKKQAEKRVSHLHTELQKRQHTSKPRDDHPQKVWVAASRYKECHTKLSLSHPFPTTELCIIAEVLMVKG